MEIEANVATLRERIDAAAAGRDVRIVAVTKTFPAAAVQAAVDAGLTDVGENYAQEARQKYELLETEQPQLDVRWHFIGHLQRNKVKLIAPFVHLWQSLDSVGLIDEVAKRAPGAQALIEVNLTNDPARGGCGWGDVARLVEHATAAGLDVRGLMTIGPLGEPEEARSGFRRLATEAAALGLPELSMGMSADLEVAVQEGATMVRVGSALFGRRPPRP